MCPTARSGSASAADRRGEHRPGIRADIEGLRAVAVLAVVLYHAGLAWTPGGFVGVDVFFVISGFLITSLIAREVERDGRLRLGRFWARRARRLLPASTLVLGFSALVTVLWLPATSRRDFGGDIVAAAGYVVNWRLGYREIDYLAEDVGASPVRHYWSLAVEEQFYVLWPLLVALVVALVATRRRTALLGVVAVVTAASFAWAVHYSPDHPGLSFFVTTTRLWELGVGALLALAYPVLVRIPARLRAAGGWLGLVAIALAVLRYDATLVWPGPATLLPVLGTAAAILAGGTAGGPARLLGWAPAVWVGGLSYSLYLWHWPFLVAAHGIGGEDLRVRTTLLVVLASAVPAYLSLRFVENPIRTGRRWAPTRPALLLGAGTTVVSALTGLAVVASFALVGTVRLATPEEAPGAPALSDPAYAGTDWSQLRSVSAMRPLPTDRADLPRIYDDRACLPRQEEQRFALCEFGDTRSQRTVVLVGDSKAAQWFTPIEQIARDEGWRLVLITLDGCSFADVVRPYRHQRSPSCESWSRRSLAEIVKLEPELVIPVTRWRRALRPDQEIGEPVSEQAMVDGLVHHWRAVLATDARVVPILDTPGRRGGRVPQCVQAHLDDFRSCGYPLAEGRDKSGIAPVRAAAKRVPEVRLVDMLDIVCPDGRTCPPVIGNVLVYRGGSHLSDTYATSARGILAERLAVATEGLFGAG